MVYIAAADSAIFFSIFLTYLNTQELVAIFFIHHFAYYILLYYQGAIDGKNKDLIPTDSMLFKLIILFLSYSTSRSPVEKKYSSS